MIVKYFKSGSMILIRNVDVSYAALKKYNKDHKAVWLKGADHFQNSLFFRHKLEFYSEVEKYLKTDSIKNTEVLAER